MPVAFLMLVPVAVAYADALFLTISDSVISTPILLRCASISLVFFGELPPRAILAAFLALSDAPHALFSKYLMAESEALPTSFAASALAKDSPPSSMVFAITFSPLSSDPEKILLNCGNFFSNSFFTASVRFFFVI